MIDLILADPDWSFADGLGERGSASRYGSTTIDTLVELRPLLDPLLAPDCVLAMWFASAMPHEAYVVMQEWGFTQKQIWVWMKQTKTGKQHFGMGRYARAAKECLYIGVRGKPTVHNRSMRDVFAAPMPLWGDGPDSDCPGPYDHLWNEKSAPGRPVHSGKPVELYTRLERMFEPYHPLELHARRAHPGWIQVGRDLPDGLPGRGDFDTILRGEYVRRWESAGAVAPARCGTDRERAVSGEEVLSAEVRGAGDSGAAVRPARGDGHVSDAPAPNDGTRDACGPADPRTGGEHGEVEHDQAGAGTVVGVGRREALRSRGSGMETRSPVELIWCEPFAGTGAVGLRAVGLKPLVNYQGTKRRYATKILNAVGNPQPTTLVFCDAGPWGRAWHTIGEGGCDEVASVIEIWSAQDAGKLYSRLAASPPPADPIEWCATFLALQRLNFKGKPVWPEGQRWHVDGLDTTAAYGRAATVKFGAVTPLLPTVVPKLRAIAASPVRIVGLHGDYREAPDDADYYYFDPPYPDTAGYRDTCDEAAVVAHVQHLASHATVLVSYGTDVLPLGDPLSIGRRRGPRLHSPGQSKGRNEFLYIGGPDGKERKQGEQSAEAPATAETPSGDHAEASAPGDGTGSEGTTGRGREPRPVQRRDPESRKGRKRRRRLIQEKGEESMHIKRLRSPTIKGGFDVELGPKTLIVGENASGKTAITQGAELLVSGTASDIAGKDRVSTPVDLLALADEADLIVEAEWSTGDESSFTIKRKGPGKGSRPKRPKPLPAGVNGKALPLRGLMDVVRASPERARRFFLEAACGVVGVNDVLDRLPSTLRAFYARATGVGGEDNEAALQNLINSSADPIEQLLAVNEKARKKVAALNREVRATTQAFERQQVSDAPIPTQAQIDDATQRIEGIQRQLQEAAKERAQADYTNARRKAREAAQTQIEQLQGAMASVQALRAEAEAKMMSYAKVLQMHQEAREGRASPKAVRDKARAAAFLLDAMAAKDATVCGLCGAVHASGHFPTRASQLLARLREAAELPPITPEERQAGEAQRYWMVLAENYAEQLRDAERVLAEKRQLVDAVPIQPVEPVTSVDQLESDLTQLQAWRDKALQARASKQTLQRLRDQTTMLQERAHQWAQLVDACNTAVTELLHTAVDTFTERVQRYLPETDVFGLRLYDGDREVLQYGLMRETTEADGTVRQRLDTALSGAEWARVTAAITCALSDEHEYALLVLEERDFSPTTLREVMTALADAPCQVLMQSTSKPHRGRVKNWTIVERG